MRAFWKQISTFQVILLGFLAVILLGSLLLMLPVSASAGTVTSFPNALFTATSAVCVTGLIVQDTATYWSEFGQAVILLLIQIGGLGVISAASAISLLAGRRIRLRQRSTIQEAISAPQVGGVVRFTRFILKFTFCAELLGALCMLPVFAKDFGLGKGIWYAVFHAVSAFCNAGFDLMGVREPYSSLTSFVGEPLINLPIMLLILSGGLGFYTWDDIFTHRFRFSRYHMQSKIILVMTAVLVVLPAAYFFFAEFSAWQPAQRIFASLFQAITPRTAGFNTASFSAMKDGSIAVLIVLMLIGGAPGSTAGGLKTTTAAVLISSAVSVFRRNKETHFFGRRIPEDTIAKASALLLLYLALFLAGGVSISLAEGLPLQDCLFETASAVATVGLTVGITPTLGLFSKIVLILLMFFGRVGGLTFLYAAVFPKQENFSKLPLEKINIG